VGLSETAFVSKSNIADFKLYFFTLTRQIAHCGHATIATFSYLSQQGRIKEVFSSKENIEGKRENLIQGDLAFMEQEAPRFQNVEK
jgi:predicted PhzF superfamily epimerase YddE/YHI9